MFRNLAQQRDEPVDAYVARLRAQAVGCEFDDLDNRILEQLIELCASAELRKKLLTKGDDLQLAAALEIARSFESVNFQAASMLAQAKPVFALTPQELSPSSDSPRGRECLYCSTHHPFRKDLCPARNVKCRHCGDIGHYAGSQKCPGSAATSSAVLAGATSTSAASSADKPSRGKKKAVRVVDQDYDSEDYGPPIFISALQTASTSAHSLYADLLLLGKKSRFLLDSGAGGNLLPLALVPKSAKLTPARSPLRLYDGSPLPCLGRVKLPTVNPRTKKKYHVLYHVVEAGCPLLGLQALRRMRLMDFSAWDVSSA